MVGDGAEIMGTVSALPDEKFWRRMVVMVMHNVLNATGLCT